MGEERRGEERREGAGNVITCTPVEAGARSHRTMRDDGSTMAVEATPTAWSPVMRYLWGCVNSK